MEQVKAFKCSYCGKLYNYKNSCRSHEKKCYHNPVMQSCVSCALFHKAYYHIEVGKSIEFSVCLKNEDLSRQLRHSCAHYLSKDEDDIQIKINDAKATCNLDAQADKYNVARGFNDAPF